MDPQATVIIEQAKRAILGHPDDPRTPALVERAKGYLDHSPAWQDTSLIENYAA